MHTTMLWQLRRVLDRHQMVADAARLTERVYGLGRVVEQRRLNAASLHALAMTLVPFRGPILVS